MKNSITDQLKTCLKECMSVYSEHDVISAQHLASCAIKKLDPNDNSPPSIAWGCNLHLREMSRELLRKTYDPIAIEKEDPRQVELFKGLQDSYPAFRDSEFVYVARMDMTYEERVTFVKRMINEVSEKQKHIDAFEEETLYLAESGFFDIEYQL